MYGATLIQILITYLYLNRECMSNLFKQVYTVCQNWKYVIFKD